MIVLNSQVLSQAGRTSFRGSPCLLERTTLAGPDQGVGMRAVLNLLEVKVGVFYRRHVLPLSRFRGIGVPRAQQLAQDHKRWTSSEQTATSIGSPLKRANRS
jgi:hypothetical protein